MIDLIENFSLSEIILCIIGIAVAIKGIWSFIDYFKTKYNEKFNKDHSAVKEKEEIKKAFQEANDQHQESLHLYNTLNQKIDILTNTIKIENQIINDKLNILSDSNRNGIKAWLVKTYYESLEGDYVDDFTKDLIEKRFDDYKKLGGNSYIEQLVNKMRSMPTQEEYEATLK